MTAPATFRAGVVMSLLAVLKETQAEKMCRLSSIVGQLIVSLDFVKPDTAAMGGSLGELQREAQHLGLRYVDRHLERVKDHFISGSATTATMKPMIVELYHRLLEEMEDRLFLTMSADDVKFYTQPEPLFGPEVDTAFPSTAEDIAESGKCFALARYTAAVFHLMRVLEVGLGALSATVGASPGNPNWEIILNAITSKINQMGPTTDGPDWKERQQALSETVAQFRIFKHAWRNYVTHTRVTYDEARARSIYESVREFMQHLSGIAHE